MLHPTSGQFFAQRARVPFHGISRHEFMRKPTLGVDLSPDIFVKAQYGLVFQSKQFQNSLLKNSISLNQFGPAAITSDWAISQSYNRVARKPQCAWNSSGHKNQF
jgi:hypothetical protein